MFKIPFFCNACAMENSTDAWDFLGELTDSQIYSFTCQKGHQSSFILTQFKFEILFDIGARAITDGYYREAISSFSASLERSYEIIIKIFLTKQGLSFSDIDLFWKNISVQSERQLGAYLTAYATTIKKNPPILSRENIELRNAVTHKGNLPTKEESIQYGQDILNIIRKLTRLMREDLSNATEKYKEEIRNRLDPNETVGSFLNIPTIISSDYDTETTHQISLTDALQNFCTFK